MKSTVLACNSLRLVLSLAGVAGVSVIVSVGDGGVIISIEIIDGSIVAVMFGVCVVCGV